MIRILAMLLAASQVSGARLEWDAHPDPTVTNYIVYRTKVSGSFATNIYTGTNLFWSVPKESPAADTFAARRTKYPTTNFFVVKAGNEFGESTGYQDQIAWVREWLASPHLLFTPRLLTWGSVSNATNYVLQVFSTTWGTNVNASVGTNRSVVLSPMTNGSWAIRVKADGADSESKWAVVTVYNVPLRVPSGKHYVERGSTLTNWSALYSVTGPTTPWFPTTAGSEFFRTRPFYTTMASAKGGATAMLRKPSVRKPTVKPAPVAPKPVRLPPLQPPPNPAKR